MSVVCTTRDYILSAVDGSPSIYWYWDKQLKQVLQRSYGSITDFYELSTGSVIDVVESAGKVYVVTKGDSITPVVYNLLTSTSGDENNKLLSATYASSPGGTLSVSTYAMVAKETTNFALAMQLFTTDSPAVAITPCFNDFIIADNIIITAWCDGFILNEIITTSGVANLVQTANSITCGYSAPIDPFRFSEEIEIEYQSCVLINPVAIVWKNAIGGWDYWVFQKNQTQHIDTASLGSFTKEYSKISDVNNPITERGKVATTRMILGAESLTTDQVNGIKSLLTTNKAYILNPDGSVNREVSVLPGTFLIMETEALRHDIELEILDIPINTIQN